MLDGHKRMIRSYLTRLAIGLFLAVGPVSLVQAEDGYDLWLRYQPLAPAAFFEGDCQGVVGNDFYQ